MQKESFFRESETLLFFRTIQQDFLYTYFDSYKLTLFSFFFNFLLGQVKKFSPRFDLRFFPML